MPSYTTTAVNALRKITGTSNANDIDAGIGALADDLDPIQLPIGAVTEWAGASDPSGGKWAVCDGRPLSRTTYAALFAAIGTTYGAGNGTTTFNVPNAAGRTVVSPEPGGSPTVIPNSNRALGQSGGEERHVLGNTEIPPITSGSTAVPTASPTANVLAAPGVGGAILVGGNLGGAVPHNNMPPYLVLNRIIRIA